MRKFILRLVCYLSIPIIASHLFVWFYEAPQREALKNGTSIKLTKWNAIKTNKNAYDIIILGSSRGYSSYNPLLVDSATNLCSYNMCTGSQHIIESYYILKEVLKYQKPKYVVYEAFLPSFRVKPDLYHVFSNAKFMSKDIIVNNFIRDKLLDIFVPIFKYKSYLKKEFADFLKANKPTDHIFAPDKGRWINGYHYSERTNDPKSIASFGSVFNFSNTNILSFEEIEHHLKSLKVLCDKNEVTLICIRAPYPPTRLERSLVDDAHHYFSKFFSSQEIQFYDLNYVSEMQYTDYDFEDNHHMNSIGAQKASKDLADILNYQEKNIVQEQHQKQ